MNIKTVGSLLGLLLVIGLVGRLIAGLLVEPVVASPVSLSAVEQRLLSARADGRPAVLYLYASWCPACQSSILNLNRSVRRFGDEVSFVVVSLDEDPEALEALLDLTGAEFEPLVVPAASQEKVEELVGRLGGDYPEVIPYGAVVSREGTVRYEWSGTRSMTAWEGALEEAL